MIKKKRSARISRRELLELSSGAALGLGKVGCIAQLVLDGIFNNALAQSGDYKKKYIYMGQAGAPSRWTFDLPLIPDGNRSKYIRNTHVGTKFTGGTRYTDTEYATTLVNGLHMPWMWRFDIPTSNGQSTPMRNLMDGMLMIRGVDTKNPAHGPAQAQHLKPKGIPYSLPSLTADRSDAPIAAISFDVYNYSLTSMKGHTATVTRQTSDILAKLMAPYNKTRNTAYEADQADIKSELSASINALNGETVRRGGEAASIGISMTAAESLFGRDFGNLTNIFNNLYGKYKTLISRAIDQNTSLAGINDKPVGTTGARNGRYDLGGNRINQDDLRTIISSATNIDRLAQRFAATEFLIVNNLSSSISMNLVPFAGLGGGRHLFDEHNSGSMATLFINTFYNRALASCLYELISVLKSNNMYEDTVIDLCGEFGRTPRGDGTGSDHSATGNCQTLFSGSVKGAHCIGDIMGNSTERNKGTWGPGTRNPGVGLLGHEHFVTTLSSLLGVPSQVTSVGSLVKLENGQFVPILPTGKLV